MRKPDPKTVEKTSRTVTQKRWWTHPVTIIIALIVGMAPWMLILALRP